MRWHRGRILLVLHGLITGGAGVISGCAPAIRPLAGDPIRTALPAAALDARPHQLRFRWQYAEETFEARGEGVVRVVAPDRARLDFFLANGMAGGYAVLIGDSLRIPGVDMVRRLLPPVPLLWAALGRLALPATVDTVARQLGDTLRADLGVLRGGDATASAGRAWRVLFADRELTHVEHIEDGRLIERVDRRRSDGQWQVQYLHPRGRRRLDITVTDTTFVERFDEAIWRRVQDSGQEP